MSKGGRYGKYGENKRRMKMRKQGDAHSHEREMLKGTEHRKISPKHPGMGRK